jgi:hypothetical protein
VRSRLGIMLLLVAAAVLAPRPATAQSAAVEALNTALHEGQRAHLKRVALWGALNLAAGAALFGASDREGHPTRRTLGLQSAAWGAINLGIAGWGFMSGPPEAATTLATALAAEDRWAHILLVNLGLNVGYMAVGTALVVAADRGLRSGPDVKGHGAAVVLQGAGLMVLDGLAWAASTERMTALRTLVTDLQVHVAAGPVPGATSLAVRIPATFLAGG